MAAPVPKPARLKLMEGRSPGRDSGGRKVKTPPPFKRVPPAPPEWLGPVARAHWDSVLPELMRLDLVKEIDGGALASLCECWELLVTSAEAVHREGLTVINTGSNGSEQHATNPSVGVLLKAQAAYRSWCGEFGLTPSAETKVVKAEVPDGEADSPFA